MTTITLSPQARPLASVESARRTASTSVRLTRRGRVVVFGVGLMASLGLGLGLSANSTASEQPQSLVTITVGPGDTLWQIARSVASDGRTGEMMEQIKDLNHLAGGSLQVGQTLRVPGVN